MRKTFFYLTLLISPTVFALGNINITNTDTGGKVSFNSAQAPQNTVLKFSSDGRPYLASTKSVSLSGAKSPITLAIKQPITKAAASSALFKVFRATTPVGLAITAGSFLYDHFEERDMLNPKLLENGIISYQQIVESSPTLFRSDCISCDALCGDNPRGWYYPTEVIIGSLNNDTCTCLSSASDPYWGTWTNEVVYGSPKNPNCKREGKLEDKTISIESLQNQIASQSGWPTTNPESSPFGKALSKALQDPDIQIQPSVEGEEPPKPIITGQTSISGGTKTSTTTENGQSVTKTENTTYNITYEGDTYNITKNTTTTTVNNETGETKTDQAQTDTLEKPPEEEKPDSTFSGNCDSLPNCQGDSILCAIAQATYSMNCVTQQIAKPDTSAQSAAIAARDGTDGTSTDALKDQARQVNISQFDMNGSGWSRSCPQDPQFDLSVIHGGTFVIPFHLICQPLAILSNIAVSLTVLGSLMWVVGYKA